MTAERTSRHPPVAVAVVASCAPLPPGRRASRVGVLLAQGISSMFTPPPAEPAPSADSGYDDGDDGWDMGDVF